MGLSDYFPIWDKLTKQQQEQVAAVSDLHHVKSGTELLRKKAKEINADIVLYGHTHVKKLEYDGDTIIMNPGSVKSYGLITIDNDKINAEIKDYE